jgi:hypothetical protein
VGVITMITLTTNYGEQLTGITYPDLVRQLWTTARAREPDKLTYMAEVSRRVNVLNKAAIRTERCRLFLRDLERAGLVRITLTDTSKGG